MDLASTPSFRLDGRRALVTGGGRGIGLAKASMLAEQANIRVRRYGGRNIGTPRRRSDVRAQMRNLAAHDLLV